MTQIDLVLGALADVSIRAVVIAAAVAIVLHALRVRTASVRHAVWTAVMVAMLILPIASRWLPSVPIWLPQPGAAVTQIPEEGVPQPAPRDREVIARAEAVSAPKISAQPVVGVLAAPAPASPSPDRPFPWNAAIFIVWITGAVFMGLRLAAGWWWASRLTSRVRSTAEGVYESESVATPVVTGLWRPRIVVPRGWQEWSDHQQQAVIIHEQAHVSRRDGLVDFVARINRCVYWFHPLAWWLDRQIQITAEEACDDEVIKSMGQPRMYANTLVQMADFVRREGGRVRWQAIGMAGAPLHARIDRVLSGRAALKTSVSMRSAIAIICAAIIGLGAACRQNLQNPPALRPNPEVAAQLKKDQERVAAWETARDLTLPEVAALEAQVAKNPDDLETTRQLLTFYTQSGQKMMGWNAMVPARRKHLLRVIERHPDSDLAYWPMKQAYDPEGWAQARKLWMRHVSAPDVTTKVLSRAAAFFAISEKPMAEQLLLRAHQMEPNGPQPRSTDRTYNPRWTSSLGRLYAAAIVGSDDEMLFNVVRSVSLAESQNAFAKSARAKLAESKDPVMLRTAGQLLVYAVNGRRDRKIGDQNIDLGFDYVALGESYLDRAAALDPDSEFTRRFEANRRHSREYAAQRDLLETKFSKTMHSVTPEDIKTLPDSDQLSLLPDLASDAHMWGEHLENTEKDKAKFAAQLARARGFAEALIAVADRMKHDPRAKMAAYEGHLSLGLAALREGNRQEAVAQLGAAASSIAGGDLRETSVPSMQYRLTNYLLKDGERESVANFFEQVSKVPGPDQQRFETAAKAIRAGEMPEQFQRAMNR